MNKYFIFSLLLFITIKSIAQTFYIPGGAPVNSTNGFAGIGTVIPSARFHINQSNGGWNDGLRLSLQGKSWDIVTDGSGNRLLIAAGQSTGRGLFLHTSENGPAVQMVGETQVKGTLEVIKPSTSSYLQIFRSGAAGNDSYLYNIISPSYHLIGSSRNGTALLRNIGFAIGTSDSEGDIKMVINTNGNVGIGTRSPDATLTVNGNIHSKEVKVDVNIPVPDYVFSANYQLLSLKEIETYIKDNSHLPEVPSAEEMEQNGIKLSEMNILLLKKVEELTLHLIEQNKKNELQENQIELLQKEIELLKKKE